MSMKRFLIQRMCRNGDWDYNGEASSLDEAITLADIWARKDPRCAWGVRVWDDLAATVAYEP